MILWQSNGRVNLGLVALALLIGWGLGGKSVVANEAAGEGKAGKKMAAIPVAQPPALDQIKQLAGDWEGTATHGEETIPATVGYQVTAGGSAVVETLGAGTEHEMVSMYYMDEGELAMVHYCMLGNQPRMMMQKGDEADKLDFVHEGGSNIGNENDAHMHSAAFTFVTDDHFKAQWSMYMGGEQADVAKMDMHRVKN